MQAKCAKQKTKLTTLEESLKKMTLQHDTLKVNYETVKTKSDVTLVEREKEIALLTTQISQSTAKE